MKKIISLIMTMVIVLGCVFIPVYGAEQAKITSPTEGKYINPDEEFTIKWAGASGKTYKISVQNENTGAWVFQNEKVNGNSFTIKANRLNHEEKYKIWLGTFDGEQLVGNGDEISIRTQITRVTKPDFLYPLNNRTVPFDQDLNVQFSNDARTACWLTIKDETDGVDIVNMDDIKGTNYIVSKSLLKADHDYTAWIVSYKTEAHERKLIGSGKTITFKTEDGINPPEAVVEYPMRYGVFATKDITVRLADTKPNAYYKITVSEAEGAQRTIINKENANGNTYKIPADTLSPGVVYNIWVGTYLNPNDENPIGEGNVSKFWTTHPYIEYPYDKQQVDANQDLKISLDCVDTKEDSRFESHLYIVDIDTEEVILDNVSISGDVYTLKAGTLKNGKDYRLILNNFDKKTSEYVDGLYHIILLQPKQGVVENDIYIDGFSIEADGISDWVDYKADVTLQWRSSIDTLFSLNLTDVTEGKTVFDNVITNETKYVIRASMLKPNHEYKSKLVAYTDKNKKTILKEMEKTFKTREEIKENRYIDIAEGHKNYLAIEQLSTDGVLSGDGTGYFKPKDFVTRAQFAKMLCEAFDLPLASSGSSFTDVPANHWAYSYITTAQKNNIISGKGNGIFAPNDTVTFQEAAKMLVCVKGWEETAKQNGGWPNGYVAVAKGSGFFANTSMADAENYATAANRGDVAQMFYNAMNATKVGVEKSDRVKFEEILEETAASYYGHKYNSFTPSESYVPWCVYCATKIAREALKNYGWSQGQINKCVPYEGSTAFLLNFYKKSDRYYSFTSWTNSDRDVSATTNVKQLEYMPKVGDFVAIDTVNETTYPDHTELIVDVDEENLTFITIAGNTSVPTVCYKDYVYNKGKKLWTRKGNSMTYVHGFSSPEYPN